MKEEQARIAAKLIKELDETILLQEKILSFFKKAQKGDSEALEWITNTAIMLQKEVVEQIRRNINSLN